MFKNIYQTCVWFYRFTKFLKNSLKQLKLINASDDSNFEIFLLFNSNFLF